MMLQALIAYAERENLGDPDFEAASIHWLIPLTSNGKLSSDPIPLYDDPTIKKPQPKKLLRAFTSPNELNQGDKSHFLADSLERAVLMPNPKAPEKAEGRRVQHVYFRKLLTEASVAAPSAAAKLTALLTFLSDDTELAQLHTAFVTSKAKPTDNATFEVAGEKLLDDPALKTFWRNRRATLRASTTLSHRVCLASGQLAETLDTTEKIRGVPGGLATGTTLIAFNKECPSFASYGLKQAQNAAISPDSELKFRSALNTLISLGWRPTNDSIHLHWTRDPAPTDLFALLTSADEAEIKNLLSSAQTGIVPASLQANAYYALSLSGNLGRIVVRDWLECTVSEVEAHIRRWFSDLTIISPDGSGEENAFKLGRLLYAMVRDKIDELPPQIPTQLLYAALRGTPLPQTALTAALRRQQIENKQPGDHADPRLNPARMALIRACINRSPSATTTKTIMTPSLDSDSSDSAYLCGRLFAVFDRLQYLALGGVNAGVVERFYASASVTPALVMGRLFRNAQFHLAKAGGGIAENTRKDFEEISSALGKTFPASLDLEAQGRFALGYYHQKADYRRRTAERNDAKAATA